MTDKTFWESIRTEGENVVERLKQLIHEGNVRRIVIQHQGRTVAEFPLTAGVVGAAVAHTPHQQLIQDHNLSGGERRTGCSPPSLFLGPGCTQAWSRRGLIYRGLVPKPGARQALGESLD